MSEWDLQGVSLNTNLTIEWLLQLLKAVNTAHNIAFTHVLILHVYCYDIFCLISFFHTMLTCDPKDITCSGATKSAGD